MFRERYVTNVYLRYLVHSVVFSNILLKVVLRDCHTNRDRIILARML